MEQQLHQAASLLASAKRVVVLSGAGMSQESGIPTFREAQTGLWAQYDPADLASPEGFHKDPGLVWRWYAWRRSLVQAATPNPGHLALAALERLVPTLVVITQNVDGLHQKAGSQDVLELHGSLNRFRCHAHEHPADVALADSAPDLPPACPACGSLIRPAVIWFGEALPRQALERAQAESEAASVMLVIGTSGIVQPAALLPYIAARAGARLIEINPDQTILTPHVNIHLGGPSGEVLPRLVETVAALVQTPSP